MSSFKNKAIGILTAISGIMMLVITWDTQSSMLTSLALANQPLSDPILAIIAYLAIVLAWVLWIIVLPFKAFTMEEEVDNFTALVKSIGSLVTGMIYVFIGIPLTHALFDGIIAIGGTNLSTTLQGIFYFTTLTIAILLVFVTPWYQTQNLMVKEQ